MRWAGHAARVEETINAYRILVGKLNGKRPFGRHKRWWEGNIKMNLKESGKVSTGFIWLRTGTSGGFL
jgi:hypothetical protein